MQIDTTHKVPGFMTFTSQIWIWKCTLLCHLSPVTATKDTGLQTIKFTEEQRQQHKVAAVSPAEDSVADMEGRMDRTDTNKDVTVW